MTVKRIIIATRKSPLALWQARHIQAKLKALSPETDIELLPLVTAGDKFLKDRLSLLGGKGLFVKELEEALLDGRADLAVHSMKDVPAELPEGLCLATITERESPFDAFVSSRYNHWRELPQGAVVGTASMRRQSQLLALRPDLTIKVLRGNIQTRLSKVESGAYDAAILAASGLNRMGLSAHIRHCFDAKTMLPSCGQGALGLECRADDAPLLSLLEQLHDKNSFMEVSAERRVNARLGGNCHVPLAVFAHIEGEVMHLHAKLMSTDGLSVIESRQSAAIDDYLKLGDDVADALYEQGAQSLLESLNVRT